MKLSSGIGTSKGLSSSVGTLFKLTTCARKRRFAQKSFELTQGNDSLSLEFLVSMAANEYLNLKELSAKVVSRRARLMECRHFNAVRSE